MIVNLDAELEHLVQSQVETGRYKSAVDVVRAALLLMQERDEIRDVGKEDMRQRILAGMTSLRAGKGIDGEAFFAQMENEFDDLERREQR